MCVAAQAAAITIALTGCGDDEAGGPPAAFVPTGIDLSPSKTIAWGDLDCDGNMDLMGCSAGGVFVYHNDYDGFSSWAPGLPPVYGGVLELGDYDGDGSVDVLIAGMRTYVDVAQVWSNTYGVEFSKLEPDLIPSGMVYGAGSWGDYDNDGDLDISLIGETESSVRDARLFLNEGGTGFTETAFAVEGVSGGDIAAGDCDNDGDLDIAVAGWGASSGSASIYHNDGGSFADVGASLVPVSRSSLAWGDYDNDGDLDLALMGYSTGPGLRVALVYENDGVGGFTDIDAGLLGNMDGSLSWGDYDNDGDLDLLVGGDANVYRNDGGGVFTRLEIDFPSGQGPAAWGDYDGDGDLDIAFTVWYWDLIYRNTIDEPNDPPDAPSGLAADVTGAGPTYDVAFSWDPSAGDDHTPTPGLTYNLRVVEDSSGVEVMPGMSIVGGELDGKRLIPAMGNVQHAGPVGAARRAWTLHLPAGTYRWSVQAVDTAFAGSIWVAEETVVIPPP
jgi:hypothetical protein